jgi:hypothetical protein
MSNHIECFPHNLLHRERNSLYHALQGYGVSFMRNFLSLLDGLFADKKIRKTPQDKKRIG